MPNDFPWKCCTCLLKQQAGVFFTDWKDSGNTFLAVLCSQPSRKSRSSMLWASQETIARHLLLTGLLLFGTRTLPLVAIAWSQLCLLGGCWKAIFCPLLQITLRRSDLESWSTFEIFHGKLCCCLQLIWEQTFWYLSKRKFHSTLNF